MKHKKLVLKREVVRGLTARDLRKVGGGRKMPTQDAICDALTLNFCQPSGATWFAPCYEE